MINIKLDESFIKNTIRTSTVELQFRYNTQHDYFYFNEYKLDGETIRNHNKVATGYDFGGFYFVSNENASYATISNVTSFRLVSNG